MAADALHFVVYATGELSSVLEERPPCAEVDEIADGGERRRRARCVALVPDVAGHAHGPCW